MPKRCRPGQASLKEVLGTWVSLHCHILGQFCHQPASQGSCDWFDARVCVEGPVISDIVSHFTPSVFVFNPVWFFFYSVSSFFFSLVALKSHVVSGIGFVTWMCLMSNYVDGAWMLMCEGNCAKCCHCSPPFITVSLEPVSQVPFLPLLFFFSFLV